MAMVGVGSGSLYRQTHNRSHLAWSESRENGHFPAGHLPARTSPLPDIRPRTSPPLVLGHFPLTLYIRLAGQDLRPNLNVTTAAPAAALLYDY